MLFPSLPMAASAGQYHQTWKEIKLDAIEMWFHRRMLHIILEGPCHK